MLRCYQAGLNNNPYTNLGIIVVDHDDYGPSLDVGDFEYGSTGALHANIGTLSDGVTVEWKTLDVTASLQDDVDNTRARSQYRLRFTTQEADQSNYALFEDSGNNQTTGKFPELVIQYHAP